MLIMTVLMSTIIYQALNMIITAPLNSIDLVTDEYARMMTLESIDDAQNRFYTTPEIADIPLQVINKLLYSAHQGKRKIQ